MITKVGKSRVAFRVDHVCGQQQIVVRQLSDGMSDVFGLSGSTILGNGQPGLIVDLPGIARHYLKKLQAEEAAA